MPRNIKNDDWREPLMFGRSDAKIRLEAVKMKLSHLDRELRADTEA